KQVLLPSSSSEFKTFQIQIFAKNNNSAYLTSKGELYVWGKNNSGQLGIGDRENKLKPTLLPFHPQAISFQSENSNVSSVEEKLCFIAFGYTHTLCLTSNGNCYTCGGNYFGQLG